MIRITQLGKAGLVLLAAMALQSPVRAEMIIWTGNAGSNDWHTAGNWDLGRTPLSGDDVVIPAVGASTDVTYSTGTISANSLISDKPFVLAGGTLILEAPSAINATYTQTNGTLGGGQLGSHLLDVSGLLTWSGGTMQGFGAITANGGMALQLGFLDLKQAAALINAAGSTCTIYGSGSGRLRMESFGVLQNNGILNITTDGDGCRIEDGGGGFVANNGTINKTSTGTFAIERNFKNDNTVHIDNGVLELRGFDSPSSGLFDGAGKLNFSGGAHDYSSGSSISVHDADFSGGSVTISGTYNVPGLTTISSGTATFNSTATVGTYTQFGGTVQGSGAINVSGLLTWSDGIMQGTGTTTANGGMAINLGSPRLRQSRALINPVGQTATVSGSGDMRMANSATFTNNGTLNVITSSAGDSSITDDGGGQVVNNGTLNKSGVGGFRIERDFNNAGSVQISTGTLNLQGNGTHTGSFGGAATLALGGGLHSFNPSSSITVNNVSFSGSAVVFITGTYNVPGVTSIISGTVNFDSTASMANLTQAGGAGGVLQGGGAVNVSGLLTWSAGIMQGTGTTTANGGMAINLGSPNLKQSRTLINAAGQTATISGSGDMRMANSATFTNNGTLNVITSAAGDSSIADTGGGQVINNGTINKSGVGAFRIERDFNNAGVMNVQVGTLQLQGAFANFSGTTLTGGSYNIAGIFNFIGANIATNQATIILDGPGSQIVNESGISAFTNFATNGSSGGLTITNGRNFSAPAGLTNNGSLTVGPGSTLTVPGGLSQSGVASVLRGNGTIVGSMNSAGSVRPGLSPGTLTINGNYTQTSAGSLSIEIGGASPGSGYDQLVVNGTATLDGALQVSLINGFQPTVGTMFNSLTAAAITAGTTFSAHNLPVRLAGACIGPPEYSATAVTLSVLPACPTEWATIDCGGGLSSGSGLTFYGTIGQFDAQPPVVMSGSGFTFSGGFWSGVTAVGSALSGDMNHDGRLDGTDVQVFAACFIAGNSAGSCAPADFDGGGLSMSDVSAFVAALLGA